MANVMLCRVYRWNVSARRAEAVVSAVLGAPAVRTEFRWGTRFEDPSGTRVWVYRFAPTLTEVSVSMSRRSLLSQKAARAELRMRAQRFEAETATLLDGALVAIGPSFARPVGGARAVS